MKITKHENPGTFKNQNEIDLLPVFNLNKTLS